jgi:hypothetical protein
MKPVHFDGETDVFHVIQHGEIVPDTELPLAIVDSADHGKTMTSVWMLDDAEREAVANGANIELRTYGPATPPVSLAVSTREVTS